MSDDEVRDINEVDIDWMAVANAESALALLDQIITAVEWLADETTD